MRRISHASVAGGPQSVTRLGAVHYAARTRFKRVAVVHHAPVVPYRHVPRLPGMMPREKILRGVRPQRVQQRLRFQYLQPVYIGIAPAAKIQRVAPRIRVRAHYGMRRPGARSHVGNRHITFAQLPARVIGSVVFHGERIDAIAQFRGQRLEREVHVGEAGVASGGRNLQPIQHARRRRTFAIGSVRVPDDFVIAERTDRHAVLDDVGHHRHMPVVPRLLPLAHGRHVVEHAETRAECH